MIGADGGAEIKALIFILNVHLRTFNQKDLMIFKVPGPFFPPFRNRTWVCSYECQGIAVMYFSHGLIQTLHLIKIWVLGLLKIINTLRKCNL